MKNKILIIAIFFLVFLLGVVYYISSKPSGVIKELSGTYNPKIIPSEFSTKITNPYFTLPVGKKFVYEEKTEEGLERNEIEIEPKTREIMGVKTLVYHDRVFLNGDLVEDTEDYLAQDKDGNVWYFGEEVNNYENGIFKNHAGAWIAGLDGALPGIWIKSNHKVGDSYYQEYYRGEAEDMTDVVALNQTVKVPLGTYTDCVKMRDWSPLERSQGEHKYYCPEVGGLALVENIKTGDRAELVEVIND